jgi:hypothetical protein
MKLVNIMRSFGKGKKRHDGDDSRGDDDDDDNDDDGRGNGSGSGNSESDDGDIGACYSDDNNHNNNDNNNNNNDNHNSDGSDGSDNSDGGSDSGGDDRNSDGDGDGFVDGSDYVAQYKALHGGGGSRGSGNSDGGGGGGGGGSSGQRPSIQRPYISLRPQTRPRAVSGSASGPVSSDGAAAIVARRQAVRMEVKRAEAAALAARDARLNELAMAVDSDASSSVGPITFVLIIVNRNLSCVCYRPLTL